MTAGYAAALLHTIYPSRCVGCGEYIPPENERRACERCWESIEPLRPPFCAVCSRPLSAGVRCFRCRGKKFPFTRITAALLYGPVVRAYIHRSKFRRQARFLGVLKDFILRGFAGTLS